MSISISPAFETAVATLTGVDTSTLVPGSLQIDLINPDASQDTTVYLTVAVNVPTLALKQLVAQHLAATIS